MKYLCDNESIAGVKDNCNSVPSGSLRLGPVGLRVDFLRLPMVV